MNLKRYDIINALIEAKGYKRYLEIGVQKPSNCFDKIHCKEKSGVDPDPILETLEHKQFIWKNTSDEFFKLMEEHNMDVQFSGKFEKFDIIFIDGLHEAEQVKRDISNSLRWLNKGGRIVLHDCLPTSELMQRVPREAKEWTGDVWKALVAFRANEELRISIVDTDYGVGIICKCGTKNTIFIDNPTFEQFDEHKHEWFKIIKPEDFNASKI